MGKVRVGTMRAARPAGMQTMSMREVKKKLKHLGEVQRRMDRGDNTNGFYDQWLGMEVCMVCMCTVY